MNPAVQALAGNALDWPSGKPYAAILGLTPSKGARSPALWNGAFEALGSPARMLAIDVTPEKLEGLLDVLDADPLFLGGAVTMPHKEPVARKLGDRAEGEARRIGAVNALYRKDGRLAGANTDGEAALISIEDRFGPTRGKKAVLVGLGGAGKAVAAYVATAVGPQGRLTVSSRSDQEVAAVKLGACWAPWIRLDEVLGEAELLLNCTSVGFGAQAGASPLSEAQVGRLPKGAAVFDAIYQPSPTELMKKAAARGLHTLDGAAMNLEQAVLAFVRALPGASRDKVRPAMEAAKKRLDAK